MAKATVGDDWIDVVLPDGGREMVRAEETLNGMKQRIILILYDELYAAGEHSIEGRLQAADRIISEIIRPLRDASIRGE